MFYNLSKVLLNSIDKDGTQSGYDLKLIKRIANNLSIPLIACGGASSLSDFHDAIHLAGASAVAAGSFFVFVGLVFVCKYKIKNKHGSTH